MSMRRPYRSIVAVMPKVLRLFPALKYSVIDDEQNGQQDETHNVGQSISNKLREKVIEWTMEANSITSGRDNIASNNPNGTHRNRHSDSPSTARLLQCSQEGKAREEA